MENLLLSVLSISMTTSIAIFALLLLGSLINKRYVAKWKYGFWIILTLRLLIPFNYELPGSQFQITIPNEVESMTMSSIFEAEAPLSGTHDTDSDAMVPLPAGSIMAGTADSQMPGTMSAGSQTAGALPAGSQMTGSFSENSQITAPLPAGYQSMTSASTWNGLSGEAHSSLTLLQALAHLWAAGALCLLIWHLAGFCLYKRRIMKQSRVSQNPLLLEQLLELSEELDVQKEIPILISKKADSPMIMGFWRPVLVLPESDYDWEESYYILKHELIHYKRHDVFIKFLLLLARDIHWFNPLVYLMRREAVVDMELACDEAVVRGSSLEQREAYTETLMATLHRQKSGGALLSTQFGCGKRVMKKRFKNILTKAKKRNGVILFAGILLITVTVGALTGLAVEATAPDGADGMEMPDRNEGEDEMPDLDTEAESDLPEEDAAAELTREPTQVLILIKEGFEEEAPATLYEGEGYSFYLIDGDWVMTEPGSWYAKINEKVRFWIHRYEGYNLDQVKEMLTEQGYEVEGDEFGGGLCKYEKDTDTFSRVRCYESGNDVWTMNSVHSLEGEEGWAVDIRAMFETFAVTERSVGGGSTAGIYENAPAEINELLYGNVVNLGLGSLAYTVPDSDDEDYKLYFYRSDNEEDRYLTFEEKFSDLSKPSYIFPDVRDGNVSIGKFKEIYFLDTVDMLGDGTDDVIVIAVYEKDGKKYYDTRVYEAGENGYVVNTALTRELNERYSDVEDYPVQDIVHLPGEQDYTDPQMESVMTLFYTAYFNKDMDTLNQCLAQDYQGKVSFMSEVGSLEDVEIIKIKGWEGALNTAIGDECVLSLEFRVPNDDSLTYLTVGFIKEDAGWKVKWYGVEK